MSFFRRAGAAIARIFQSAADPAAETDKVLLYGKDVAGVSQLFARSDDGTVHQITPGGGSVTTDASLSGAGTVPSPLSTEAWDVQPLAGPLVIFTGSQKPTTRFRQFNDMLNGFSTQVSAGANAEMVESGDQGIGLVFCRTFNPGENSAIVPYPQRTPPLGLALGTLEMLDFSRFGFDARLRVSGILPQSAADNWTVYAGIYDRNNISDFTQRGIGFIAGFGATGNSNWWARVRSAAGALQLVDTGIALDVTVSYHRFTFVYDEATGNVLFYIDGALVATINEPDLNVNGLTAGPMVGIAQIANSAAPALHLVGVDWVDMGGDIDRSGP